MTVDKKINLVQRGRLPGAPSEGMMEIVRHYVWKHVVKYPFPRSAHGKQRENPLKNK